ncbi:transporter [Flavobacteriaceae bacterium LMO-SS05]
MFRIVISIALLIVQGSTMAQSIVTDRPDQTESSSTVTKGSLQIEAGFLVGSSKDNLIKERQILAPTTLFRYGITDGLELRLGSQFESLKNRQTNEINEGLSDLELGAKVQLFKKENRTTEIAFLSHLIIPTGAKGLTNDKLGTINKLSISHTLTETFGIGYNIGYNYFGMDKGDFTYSLAVGIGFTDTIGIYLEPYGEVLNFETHEASFDVGITYLLQDNLQLDASFGTGINHNMNYVALGFSINMAKKSNP